MPWILRDKVLAPAEEITISYGGPNPFQAYKIVMKTIDLRLGIPSKDIFEDEFKWDITADPRDFYVKIRVRKSFDAFSKGWVYIVLRGKQPTDPEKPGNLTVELSGELVTEFKVDGWKMVLIPFVYLYHLVFYRTQRKRYIDEVKSYIFIFEDEIRTTFKLK
jgi:cbb3-type cytochrome oxidase subunit 3